MRTLKVWSAVAASVAAYAMPWLALAQQPAGNVPPPRLEKLEEGEEPTVTIRKPEQQRKTAEKRAPGGKVTEIKVTTGGSTYYLKANDSAGSALPGDTQGSNLRAAQWEVLEFDLNQSKEAKEAEAAETATVPPPPAKK